ncbi:hypothetical protein BU15DRAFT_60492 [Melanogaster broomeanus]|nr:hypothetical protein BU15DRAFT_60492 [Melanogaster broomeanus]
MSPFWHPGLAPDQTQPLQPWVVMNNLFEEFRSTVWGNNDVFKRSQTVDVDGKPYSFDYLNFGNYLPALNGICPLIRSKFMIVREEYMLAMKALEEAPYQHGAAVLGQAGIGKTFFLIYALVERLRKKQPTAFQYFHCKYFLFTQNGVTTHSTCDDEPLRSWHGIWALSDSSDATIQPACAFLGVLGVRTIQATYPDFERWKEWTKQHQAGLYIMDNWTLEEFSALATVSALDVDRMRHLAHQWGPSPRYLLSIFNGKRSEPAFQQYIDAAASYFVSNSRQVIISLLLLNLSLAQADLSSLIFTRPKRDESGNFLRMQCEVYVPTARFTHAIARALLKRDAPTRSQFFSATNEHASMRGTASYIFEQWVHACFLSGVNVDCTWLNADSSNAKSLPRTLATTRPSQLISTDTELETQNPPFYWRPVSSNFPGIDGLLRRGDDVYAIQCSMFKRHQSPLEGLRMLQEIIGKHRGLSWRVIFVGPSKSQATEAAMPHVTLTEGVDSSRKRTRETNVKYIPVGVCELPIIPECHDENELDKLLKQLLIDLMFSGTKHHFLITMAMKPTIKGSIRRWKNWTTGKYQAMVTLARETPSLVAADSFYLRPSRLL